MIIMISEYIFKKEINEINLKNSFMKLIGKIKL